MPRTYKRKPASRNYLCYNPNQIVAAIADIKTKKMTINHAAKHYGIPKGTLFNKLKEKHTNKWGHPLRFSESEEQSIVKHMITVSEWGFPFDSMDMRALAKSYLDKRGDCKELFQADNMPTDDWARSFLKRHKATLSQRACQNLKVGKALLTPELMRDYFNNLKQTLKDPVITEEELATGANTDEVNVPPERIYNYDETNLCDDPGVKKCIFKRGVKYSERVRDSSKSSISIMMCGSASGTLLPPYVVYKSEHLWQTWMEGGPVNTRYNRSRSGWFDGVIFEDWFRNLLVPYTRKLNGKIVVIGDNLSSHFSAAVLKLAEENNISFVCLPINSTHICQPLDVAFYRPFKQNWRVILDKWKQGCKKKSQAVSKEVFPSLLCKLCDKVVNKNNNKCVNLIAGFRKTGICPFDPEQVISRMPGGRPTEDDEISPIVSKAVLDMLKDMRHGEDKQQRKRRRKINITPGASISLEDLTNGSTSNDTGTSVAEAHSAPQQRNQASIVPSSPTYGSGGQDDTSEDSDNIPYMDSSDEISDSYNIPYMDSSHDMVPVSVVEDVNNGYASASTSGAINERLICSEAVPVPVPASLPAQETTSNVGPKPGNFIIVKVPAAKTRGSNLRTYRSYIAEVVGETDPISGEYYVKFLRKKGKKFVWPAVPDISSITPGQIELVLRKPVILKRGFIFHCEDIESYTLL